MKIALLTITLLLWPLLGAADSTFKIDAGPAEKVADGTFVIYGALGFPDKRNRAFINNPAFIVTEQGVVVVDPGASLQVGEMLLEQIARITDRPVVAVFNTHIHGDHWLGNDAIHRKYPDAAIYGHANMLAEIEAGTGDQWIRTFNQMTEGAVTGTRVVAPNRVIGHGDIIRVAGLTFEIYHTGKAHTSSDILIRVPEKDLLFAGDNANNGRIVRMDDGSFPGNVAALDLAMELDVSVVVPGHGRSGDKSVIEAYRRYLTQLYAAVAELYEEGMGDFEMKDRVAARLEEFGDWVNFEDELGKHISLAYLEIEANEF
ncbi:MAG: MBL fold metallo-hydrolase [Pseudomonadota bacterium]